MFSFNYLKSIGLLTVLMSCHNSPRFKSTSVAEEIIEDAKGNKRIVVEESDFDHDVTLPKMIRKQGHNIPEAEKSLVSQSKGPQESEEIHSPSAEKSPECEDDKLEGNHDEPFWDHGLNDLLVSRNLDIDWLLRQESSCQLMGIKIWGTLIPPLKEWAVSRCLENKAKRHVALIEVKLCRQLNVLSLTQGVTFPSWCPNHATGKQLYAPIRSTVPCYEFINRLGVSVIAGTDTVRGTFIGGALRSISFDGKTDLYVEARGAVSEKVCYVRERDIAAFSGWGLSQNIPEKNQTSQQCAPNISK